MITGDYHIHTTCCDGKNTPEQMARAAYRLGLRSLGFTAHSHTSFDSGYCLAYDATPRYIAEISRLKKLYSGKMEILCGIEQDMYGECDRTLFDYVIGSKHYIKCSGKYVPVDKSQKELLKAGCMRDLYTLYYEQLCELPPCDIIGHFDLITKFNETGSLINEQSKRYIAIATDALDALLLRGVPFEMNSGAITRGYRTTPYPARFLLERICEKGGRIVLTSDAHSAGGIAAHFEMMAKLARDIGFKSVWAPSENGMVEKPL